MIKMKGARLEDVKKIAFFSLAFGGSSGIVFDFDVEGSGISLENVDRFSIAICFVLSIS